MTPPVRAQTWRKMHVGKPVEVVQCDSCGNEQGLVQVTIGGGPAARADGVPDGTVDWCARFCVCEGCHAVLVVRLGKVYV